jgi:uncharacterized protein GlcG (DUF336 family)
MKQILQALVGVVVVVSLVTVTWAGEDGGSCAGLPTEAELKVFLQKAAAGEDISAPLGPGTGVGGLFDGERMWAAVVNRDGRLCAFTTLTPDPRDTWPGSQAIAKAKAYTANAFSNDDLALSTARLYTFTQPGHSLFGLNQSNPFNPHFLAPPSGAGGGRNQIAGGIITFGGGVPLYKAGQIIGGLGVSGDTACADHEIAKRVRDLAGLNPAGGPLADDIVYTAVDGPSVFAHSLCVNNVRNGVDVPDEAP